MGKKQRDSDLNGAVDLSSINSPAVAALRTFTSQVVQSNAQIVVMVAKTPDGQIATSAIAPGGIDQALGLLAAAQIQLGAKMGARRG